jgi:hypothetical protein
MVLLKELIEVLMQYLKGYTAVSPKDKGPLHPHHIAEELRVFQDDGLQYSDLYLGLILEFLLALNDLQCYILFLFVIVGFVDPSERTPTQFTHNFVPIRHIIVDHDFGVTLRVSEVVLCVYATWANIEYLVLLHLFPLKLTQLLLILPDALANTGTLLGAYL